MRLAHYPYISGRRAVLGRRAALAASQPLAVAAGAEMLLAGGNAVDAAIAMAAALAVVMPTSNGLGGDAFALVHDGDRLWGLNASGKSPAALDPAPFLEKKYLPRFGWAPVTVPGVVSGWGALHARWGRLPWKKVLAPAIRLAEEGFPVSPEVARAWRRAERVYLGLKGPEFEAFKATFFPEGRAPRAGEVYKSPAHAATLRRLAEAGWEDFYRGELARQIAGFAAETGGFLREADLADHQVLWVEPIFTDYRGARVYELPPNGQGVAALIALNILEHFDLAELPLEARVHLGAEAMKRAFGLAFAAVADPTHAASVESLLDKALGRRLAGEIGEAPGDWPEPALFPGGTVYLAAADERFGVSLIQSNYMGFGAGVLVPGTGIALHNRGKNFSLAPGHPNVLAPVKRPYHTIIPGYLELPDGTHGPFGVMGGFMQPQGHVQVVHQLVDLDQNPQGALDAPRWQLVFGEEALYLESSFPRPVAVALADRGHRVRTAAEYNFFGRGQVILRREGVLVAGSEPRADGLALAF